MYIQNLLWSFFTGLVSQAVIFVVIFVYLKLETCAQSFAVFSLLLGCIVCGGIGIQSFFKHHLDIGAEKLGNLFMFNIFRPCLIAYFSFVFFFHKEVSRRFQYL